MNHFTRRGLRAGISVIGLTALGATLTGTAAAATDDHVSAGRSEAADPGSALSDGEAGTAQPGLHDFALPSSPGAAPTSRGMAVPVSHHADDEDSDYEDGKADESEYKKPNHRGSDLNDRDENLGEGEDGHPNCSPQYTPKSNLGAPYNGDRSDDGGYDSDDYRPECTGFHGQNQNNGYNGYTGRNQDRQHSNRYLTPL